MIKEYDNDRFLGHIDKVHLFKGDATEDYSKIRADHPHLVL
jgi:hypothetical protein